MNLRKNLMGYCTLLLVCTGSVMYAQSPVDGFYQGKGKGKIAVSYSYEQYDNVFLVPSEIEGVPVFNSVQKQSVSLYGVYGITDKFDVIVNLPYISAKGDASEQVLENLNFDNTRKGIQDLAIYAKYELVNKNAGDGHFNISSAIGLHAPLGNYKSDEGLQSIIAIGHRTVQVNPKLIAHYKSNSGVFATGQLGYSVRSNDAPNAVQSEIKLGFAHSKFYIDTYLANQTSEEGVDILAEGFMGDFTLTQVNYSRVGFNIFIPATETIGFGAGAGHYFSGRNLGKATGFSASLIVSL